MAWTKEKQREAQKRWIAKHPERWKEIKRRAYLKHREAYELVERAWRQKNPDKVKHYQARALVRNRLKLYGVTAEQYADMLARQQGLCYICERPQTEFKKRFSVDHDHATGVTRALLCGPCNTALGGLQDRPDLLRKAATYIEGYK